MGHAVGVTIPDRSDLETSSCASHDFRARTSCNTGSLSGRARYQPGTVARAAAPLETRATAFARLMR